MKKFISILLCVSLVFTMGITAFAETGVVYTITNPYDDVDWDSVNRYKADLHSHTNASDGDNTLAEMVQRHYELGFDIVAISDHGTVSYSWTNKDVAPAVKLFCMIKEGKSNIVPLASSGTAANGNSYTVTTVNGDDYYSEEGGKAMLRVPFANENNPTSFNNAHVNSWFADYGHNVLGGTSDYATPIAGVDDLGGLSVINHPGEYSNARDELYTADAYNKADSSYKYTIDKFENLLLDYDSCIGIDINSKGDYRTRFDRKLWDTMLTDVAPTGRNIYAIASTDAHNLDIVDSGYVVVLMNENTSAELKNSLSSGNFFAQSCYTGNLDEIKAYSAGLLASDDATAQKVGAEMAQAAAAIENEIATDKDQGTKYRFSEDGVCAEITNISVDKADNEITIDGNDMLYVRWISDGKQVAEGTSIDLDECKGIGSYVRAEIISEGAVTYTQPFLLNYDGMPEANVNEDATDFGNIITAICDGAIKALGKAISSLCETILKSMGII